MKTPSTAADGRYLLRVCVPLSPTWVTALAKATAIVAARHPALDASERLARVLAAGCVSIIDEERRGAAS